jgi:hypothetical protein
MCGTFEPFPSPLMGEGSGGGEDSPSAPHPNLPPPRGEGVLTYPCQPHGGGLIGGGQAPLPGEISLAPNAIFFLDELPEFTRHMLEVLRQPLAAAPPPLTPAPVPVNVACFSLDAGPGLEY